MTGEFYHKFRPNNYPVISSFSFLRITASLFNTFSCDPPVFLIDSEQNVFCWSPSHSLTSYCRDGWSFYMQLQLYSLVSSSFPDKLTGLLCNVNTCSRWPFTLLVIGIRAAALDSFSRFLNSSLGHAVIAICNYHSWLCAVDYCSFVAFA